MDVSGLASVGDAVHVRDVVVPDGVSLVTDGDEIIAQMAPAAMPEVEEEVAESEAQAAESPEAADERAE